MQTTHYETRILIQRGPQRGHTMRDGLFSTYTAAIYRAAYLHVMRGTPVTVVRQTRRRARCVWFTPGYPKRGQQ